MVPISLWVVKSCLLVTVTCYSLPACCVLAMWVWATMLVLCTTVLWVPRVISWVLLI